MNDRIMHRLQEILPTNQILIEEPMSRHTTFRVGGTADYYVCPSNREQLCEVLALCKNEGIPHTVIGNGSNVLVGDGGIRGIVIQLGEQFSEIKIEKNILYAQAGALLSKVANEAFVKELTGMEFAAGIPGSIGGAVMMNAGAYGGEMKDIIYDATVLKDDGQIARLSNKELELEYRSSLIEKKQWIVIDTRLQLQKGQMAAIKNKMKELGSARKEKQPLQYPSAGSTFKRPQGYFAGKLIMDAGLAGYTVGGAQISTKHCGFVINTGGATAKDITKLMQDVIERVHQQFGVVLEPEVRMIGEFI